MMDYQRMGQPDCYFTSLAEELQGKRDRLANILRSVGMEPVVPEGGYFMLVDVTALSELLFMPHFKILKQVFVFSCVFM